MPSKPRSGKGRYSPPKKKRKDRPVRPAAIARQPAAGQVGEAVSPIEVSAPVSSVPASAVKTAGVQHQYIAGELRTIGIIAGIMIAVLIVLAVVLP